MHFRVDLCKGAAMQHYAHSGSHPQHALLYNSGSALERTLVLSYMLGRETLGCSISQKNTKLSAALSSLHFSVRLGKRSNT